MCICSFIVQSQQLNNNERLQMAIQDRITTEVINAALSSMSDKEILDMTKKALPKVMQEQIESTLQDFIQDEIDMYAILDKVGVKKKLTDIITNAIKGIK